MPQNKESAAGGEYGFKIRYIFYAIPLILLVLAVFSHSSADMAVLEGGSDATFNNLAGYAGAHTARAVFYLFGLAAYPLIFLLVLCAVRGFLPFPLKRRFYIVSIAAAVLGMSMLFAITPSEHISTTNALGIGRFDSGGVEDLAISGGVVGACLAAPAAVMPSGGMLPEGALRAFIGVTGTIICAWALLIPCVIFVIGFDWFPLILRLFGLAKQNLPSRASITRVGDDDDAEEDEPEEEKDEDAPQAEPHASAAVGFFSSLFSRFKRVNAPESAADDYEVAPPSPLPGAEQHEKRVPEIKRSFESDDDDYSVAPPAAMPEADEAPGVMSAASVPASAAAVGVAAGEPSMTFPASGHNPSAASETRSDSRSANVRMYSEDQHSGSERKGGQHEKGVLCPDYVLPPVSLLDKHTEVKAEDTGHIESSRDNIQSTLDSFTVEGQVSGIIVGPRVTRFEISLAPGVMVEKVTRIQNNIAMNLEAESIRILAPIPGKNAVGIEVPNKVSSIVYIRSLMESGVWRESGAGIPILLGRDIEGKVMLTDLAKAPHLLIAGSTGSGKSVCMNTLIMSLLFRFSPEDLRLILVDPKVVELEMYKPLPHLITPVVNDPKKVPLALRWGVNEMERRYLVLARVKSKNLSAFNSRPADPEPVYDADGMLVPRKLPYIIIIIDELADIMMTEAKSDVETSICRIAQKGRAAGIHLVIATQTPRKDVVTGLIKANLPTKIAFKVGSNMDSRVILDASGAEKLLGYGDMLFRPPGAGSLERIQGSLVADSEIQKVVDFVSGQAEQAFDDAVVADDVEVKGMADGEADDGRPTFDDDDDPDNARSPEFINSIAAKYLRPGDSDLMRRALEIIINEQKASTSYLQRRLGIGYNKSAELMDRLEERGIISAPLPGGQKRDILVTDGLETNE